MRAIDEMYSAWKTEMASHGIQTTKSAYTMTPMHTDLLSAAGRAGRLDIVKPVFNVAWRQKQVTSAMAYLTITAAGKKGDFLFARHAYTLGIKAHPKEYKLYKAMMYAAAHAEQFGFVERVKKTAKTSRDLTVSDHTLVLEAYANVYKRNRNKLVDHYRANRYFEVYKLWQKMLAFEHLGDNLHIITANSIDHLREVPSVKRAILTDIYNTVLSRHEISPSFLQTILLLATQYQLADLVHRAYTTAKSHGMVNVDFIVNMVAGHASKNHTDPLKGILRLGFSDVPGCRTNAYLKAQAMAHGMMIPDTRTSHSSRLFAGAPEFTPMTARSESDLLGRSLSETINRGPTV